MNEQTQKLFLTTIAENVPKVKQQGYDEGFEAGKEKEWSDFWDTLQNYGKRKDYTYLFGVNTGTSPYNDETFKPKYDIKPQIASNMFRYCSNITDFKGILERQGVVLDFSKCANVNYAFQFCYNNTRLPELDFSEATAIHLPFSYNEKLISIDKFIVSDSGTTTFTDTFIYCYALSEIRIGGVIGRNISFQYSPLSVESMKSIITHLKNYAGTDSEKAYTLTLKSSCETELETAGFTDEDKRLLVENGITYSDNLTWVDVIDDLKWNLVWAS